MFCLGIVGFIAGLLFKKGRLKISRLSLFIYGGLATFFIFGGIINIGSLLMFTTKFSWGALAATYASAFWFDLFHAVATVFFLFVLSRPMIEKIERVKVKYGLIEQK